MNPWVKGGEHWLVSFTGWIKGDPLDSLLLPMKPLFEAGKCCIILNAEFFPPLLRIFRQVEGHCCYVKNPRGDQIQPSILLF